MLFIILLFVKSTFFQSLTLLLRTLVITGINRGPEGVHNNGS